MAQRNTALVTGAAGFIGSYLIEHLLALGWRVRGLDDFSTGKPENLAAVAYSSDFDLVEGSILDEAVTRAVTSGVTHVFHLAGRVGATYVEQHPEQTVLDSMGGIRNVLSAVRDLRVPLFFASTSEIYGNSDVQPLSEYADITIFPPANPRSSYALGKAVGELLVGSYIRTGQGQAIIGRLFNTIGPRQSGRYGHVLPRFIEWALAGEPLVVYGDGEQTRSFTAVEDAVRAIAAILCKPEAFGKTINIGSSGETSIVDLARLVVRVTGSTSAICHQPYEWGHGVGAQDVRRRVPDTTILRELTGFECKTPLETCIRTILSYRAVAGLDDSGLAHPNERGRVLPRSALVSG
jgi:UDP-glucose 4-epimerase